MFTDPNQCLEVARLCRAKAKDNFLAILNITEPAAQKQVEKIIDGIVQAAVMEFSAKVLHAESVQDFQPPSASETK